jgi:hypothetical protein
MYGPADHPDAKAKSLPVGSGLRSEPWRLPQTTHELAERFPWVVAQRTWPGAVATEGVVLGNAVLNAVRQLCTPAHATSRRKEDRGSAYRRLIIFAVGGPPSGDAHL